VKIYNTLHRKKDELSPLNKGEIKMYTCGQTVYNDIHMGNARFYVVFDAIRRYLLWKGFDVKFVQNFTDIDDKIIEKAREEGVGTEEIAERYIAHTLEDLASLNVLPATVNPKATEEIPEIIELIEQLVGKGYAYENGGTVYYDVTKFEGYGKLSRKKIDELESGARVEVEAGKKNPMDFVLWKPAKENEPFWESPWGNGRPGWHIECSAMAKKYLGDQIDIHGGAADLIFPHHENEIAQTEAATGCEFSRLWMHCGILTTDHKKMSKSRGNFFTLREMAQKFPHDVMRFYLISGHYRMPMAFNDDVLKAAQQGLNRIKNCYANLQHAVKLADANRSATETEVALLAGAEEHEKTFVAAMDDDFNTADAITAIFELVTFINRIPEPHISCSQSTLQTLSDKMIALCGILGIQIATFDDLGESDNEKVITELVAARQEARKNRDFAEADRIRDEITKMGYTLEDTPDGVRWRKA
jgi:cysteinyl-tRNA synthetase